MLEEYTNKKAGRTGAFEDEANNHVYRTYRSNNKRINRVFRPKSNNRHNDNIFSVFKKLKRILQFRSAPNLSIIQKKSDKLDKKKDSTE